jgi:hypothetical protein
MPYIIYFNGLFNKEFFGLAVYHYMIVLLIVMGALAAALWYFFFWFRLKPYHGVFWAHLRKTGVSFPFDDNMHFDLITDRSAKVIFNETFKEAQEAEGNKIETRAATIGKVAADFIFDPDKWTYPNSPQHVIIENVAERHNLADPSDQVRTLPKFSLYLQEGKFNDETSVEELAGLKRVYLVPWSRIKMMYSMSEESDFFGFIMSLAAAIKERNESSLNKYWWVLVIMFGFIDLALIAKSFLT